jgi:dTDP-4-dehydrorhamnose 3,5-epimerase
MHMVEIIESPHIAGVKVVHLCAFGDERGSFTETFRKAWFPERRWEAVQMNCSRSRAGVLRGLHYHHHQVDYWYAVQGSIRAGLVDLRRGSPTRGATQMVEMGDDNPLGLFIPIGVAHGFLALSDVVLTYLVDNYYDAHDEFGVAWDDPALGLDWGLSVQVPVVSRRDGVNPQLAELDAARLPVWGEERRQK